MPAQMIWSLGRTPRVRWNSGDIPHLWKVPNPIEMGVSINGGTPNGWFIMENPIKLDDVWKKKLTKQGYIDGKWQTIYSIHTDPMGYVN